MNYKYVLTETVYHNGKHSRKSYGIATISTADNITILESIEDVSVARETVQQLVNLCNKERLDIIHLQSLICDFIQHIG